MNEKIQVKAKKNFPLVSIITINYNSPQITCELIESLNLITYPNIEIIVVDNNSTINKSDIIKSNFPGIILIESKINVGFPGGNNLGIMRAKGEYILLINNDCVVTKNFLEPLVEKFENNHKIGAISPKIRFFHTPEKIQFAGIKPINKYTIRNHAIGYWEDDNGQYDFDYETYCVHGAAMIIPVKIIKEIGLMSYIYFLYYEELDWMERIKKAGYQLYYIHNSLVYHKESKSTGKISSLKTFYINRNRILYLRRNIHGFTFVIALIYQIFIAIPKNSFLFLIKGKFSLFYAYISAIIWHLKNLFNKDIHENPKL